MNIRPATSISEGMIYPAQYRVDFWEQKMPGGSLACASYEVTDARDVHEVIAWAESESGPGAGKIYAGADRTYTVRMWFDPVMLSCGEIHLSGTDPSAPWRSA